MFGFAALFILMLFWGFIGLVWWLEGFWMSLAVAAPFILFYKMCGRWLDNWMETSTPEVMEKSDAPRRKLPANRLVSFNHSSNSSTSSISNFQGASL